MGGGKSVWFQFRAHYKVSLLERGGHRRMMTLPFLLVKQLAVKFWRGNKCIILEEQDKDKLTFSYLITKPRRRDKFVQDYKLPSFHV